MQRHTWTDEHHQLIRRVYETHADISASQLDRKIASQLGTTATAVNRQRVLLGIKHPDAKAHQGRRPSY
jgi:hypothetical protein